MLKGKDGYWRMHTKISGTWKSVLVHRYVWELYNGPIPKGYEIHHGDGRGNFDGEGNKNCNCICNLMMLKSGEHQRLHKEGKFKSDIVKEKISKSHRKAGLRADNSSGYKGVYLEKKSNKWKAQIFKNGKVKNVGRFHTPEEAARAYDKAAIEYYGRDCFINFPQDNLSI